MIYICALLLAAPLAAQGQKENPLENTKTLFNSLTESDPAKREAAFDYVKNKRPEDLIPYLKKAILAKKGFFFAPDYSNRTVHINALKLYPFTESLKWWIEILQETGSSMMKIEIMNYITESGHRSIVMPIVDELRNNFFIVRQEAARILRGKSNDRVYPVILSMMNDPNPAVRIYAIDAMNYLYDSRFNNELINMIYDSDAGVRIRVIKSIRHNRVENTQQLIRNAAANDPNGRVRFAAINFLLDISDPSLINILAKAINESDEITRLSAVNVFYRLNSTRGAPVLCTRLRFEDSNEIKEIMLDSLIRCESVPYTDGVIKILRGDDDSSLRVKAAYLLGLRRDAQTMYALIDGLKDTQDTVRAEAASSLGNYQMIQATEALLAAIAENKNRYVRSAALYAITKSKTRGATVGLFDIFSFEEDPVFRSQLYKTVRDLIVKYH